MNIPFEGIRFGFKWKGIRYDCWTIRDITSRLEEERVRKAREREYRIQSVQLRAIFDSAPVIIWIASDASANEIVGNREAHRFSKVKSGINMSKTGPNPELLGHYDIYHNGSQLEPADMPMQRVASTGKALTDYEMEFRFDDGQKRTLMGNVTPILDPDGNPSGAVGAFLDISDRKRTEDRKDEFIGVASHELKTPLTSIKAYAQLLDRKLKDFPDESVRMILRRMDGQTNKLTGLVSDLLDASRIQTGALSVRMDDVDMDALIDEAISDILATAAENGSHTIEFRKRAGMRVRGDAFRLTQVIGNLLTNALKYSPPGAKVVVKTSEDGEGLTVSVRDFGIGIPPDKRERIFERFYQIKPENDPGSRFGSLGLGLYISSNIVRQHGGRMAIHSTPGKGSVFSFTLPVGRRGDTG